MITKDQASELLQLVLELNVKSELSQQHLAMFIKPFELRYHEDVKVKYFGCSVWDSSDYDEFPGTNEVKRIILKEVRMINECFAATF